MVRVGGTHSRPSHSEVVFELAGYRRSRKRPQSHSGGNGSPQSPKSPTRNFGRRRQGNRRWWRGRRSRAMTRNALEINKKSKVGTLRFSLWKPSPFGLWFLNLESWRLAGVLLKAVTSWCQNCPAERQGRLARQSISLAKRNIPISFWNRARGDLGASGGDPFSHKSL